MTQDEHILAQYKRGRSITRIAQSVRLTNPQVRIILARLTGAPIPGPTPPVGTVDPALARIEEALGKQGLTLEQARAMTDDELLALRSIGKKSIERIRA